MNVMRGTETILLVEDDPQLRQLSSSVLAHCGYKVLTASTPEEGLAVCQSNHKAIRLLVTDVVMPRMNGRQLAERVAKISPGIRTLYISAIPIMRLFIMECWIQDCGFCRSRSHYLL